MLQKIYLYPLIIPFSLIFFIAPNTAFAANYQLSGSVKDNSNNVAVGATVDVYNPGTTTDVVPSTTTDTSGNYVFATIPQGTYDIKVTPPSGSSFSPTIALSKNISANT
ncbi:MAG: carboxypeptidase-like regulatory domain-containing protein, partial [Candidatus Levyibacteriota bacterium]